MGIVAKIPRTKSSVLDKVRRIIPDIEARADEIERTQTIPPDLVARLQDAGAFRMVAPARFGGEEMSHAEIARVVEEVAFADASVAWNIVAGSGVHFFTLSLPLATQEAFWANGPDTWAKASATPKAFAVPVEGGYRLSGYWPLVSGVRDYEHVVLAFMIRDADGIRRHPHGAPDIRVCLIPKDGVELVPTWDAVGLRATRSDDMRCKDVFVPEASQGPLFGPSNIDGPSYRIFTPLTGAAHHTAVVVGILTGAVDDIARSASTRRALTNPEIVIGDDPVFQSRFGEIAARVEGVRAIYETCVEMVDRCHRENRDATPDEAARIGALSSLLHHDATAVMDQLMLLSGTSGIYAKSRIQRRWRDLRCIAQHIAASTTLYNGFAKSLIANAQASA